MKRRPVMLVPAGAENRKPFSAFPVAAYSPSWFGSLLHEMPDGGTLLASACHPSVDRTCCCGVRSPTGSAQLVTTYGAALATAAAASVASVAIAPASAAFGRVTALHGRWSCALD